MASHTRQLHDAKKLGNLASRPTGPGTMQVTKPVNHVSHSPSLSCSAKKCLCLSPHHFPVHSHEYLVTRSQPPITPQVLVSMQRPSAAPGTSPWAHQVQHTASHAHHHYHHHTGVLPTDRIGSETSLAALTNTCFCSPLLYAHDLENR